MGGTHTKMNKNTGSATDKICRLEGGGTVRRPATAIRRNKFVELLGTCRNSRNSRNSEELET